MASSSRNRRMFQIITGMTTTNRTTAMAAPWPKFRPMKNVRIMRSAITSVPKFPPVITKMMSKTFSALMTMYVVTTTIVGRIEGTMIRRNTWNSDAPSIRAASMISSGIALMAADRTTMANPVCIHTMITMNRRLFQGWVSSHETGSWPRPITTPFSRPMFEPNPWGRKL
jgi:hypothetical protein